LLSTTAYPLSCEDDGYEKFLGNCGQFEYDVSLYVDKVTHLYAVGFPKEDATECPMVATHAIVHLHDGAPATKELLIWGDVEQGRNVFDQDGFISVGSFTVADMAQAFEKVEPGGSSNGGAYDMVTNNCAVYLVNLASELGVKIDMRITGLVARRLLENSGSQFVESDRASELLATLQGWPQSSLCGGCDGQGRCRTHCQCRSFQASLPIVGLRRWYTSRAYKKTKPKKNSAWSRSMCTPRNTVYI
jgi:hypothetical protein